MFDCGMHMGYDDDRRFPNFSFISKTGNFTNAIDCVIITHLYLPPPAQHEDRHCVNQSIGSHLDHCGALAYFTEMCGYDGPIYMTVRPLSPLPFRLLSSFRELRVTALLFLDAPAPHQGHLPHPP